ncbi:MAG: hypothetical protein ABIS67_06020 [Candidatus Eisenbacteria bacterium]
MKRKALLLVFTAALAMAAPAKSDEFLLAFTGFDYQSPNTNTSSPAGYLVVGEGYKMVGFVTSVGPLLDPWVDFSVNEYTVYIRDLTVVSRTLFFQFFNAQFTNNGRGSYYADALSGGTPGTYGVSPPNATSPSTFNDGSERLTGDIDDFVVTFNFSTNQGNFSGNMTQDGGPDLVYIPSNQRSGWVLGGLAKRPNNTIPTGYDNQVSGECRIPDATPATHRSWGALKALYR